MCIFVLYRTTHYINSESDVYIILILLINLFQVWLLLKTAFFSIVRSIAAMKGCKARTFAIDFSWTNFLHNNIMIPWY